MTAAEPPRLQLDVPNTTFSPLITNASILGMISSPFSSPLPNISFASSADRAHFHRNPIMGDTSLPISSRYKALPFVPEGEETIPSKQILSVLDLLERMVEDVIKEVHRVRQSLKEAFAMVRECAEAEHTRKTQQKERKERQIKDTRGVDDDFWLNA